MFKNFPKVTIKYIYRKKGLTADEILANLESGTAETAKKARATAAAAAYDLIFMPPDDETVTDEDSDEEAEARKAGNPNKLGKGVLRQQAELDIIDNDDELPDLEEVRKNFTVFILIDEKFCSKKIHNICIH